MLLLQGPFESDYSLAIVNRQLAYALVEIGEQVCLHQRDNTTNYAPSQEFLNAHPRLAGLFVDTPLKVDVHSRYIYPPYTDSMTGRLNVIHCYGWEESVFPAKYVADINRDIDLITVMSEYVRRVLKQSGVRIPIVVVGLGADHITASPAEPVDLDRGTFDFVHVSSCFPRKAADVLVEAFCQEFRSGERVRLIIKTFPNPHNNIEQIARDAGLKYPGHAPIEIWQHPLSPGQMRFIYEHAGCVVAPSRGEGFGLPVAEAMLVGCPVIATAHGGHADICAPGSFWPVEFRIERAKTHLTEQHSYWAEPSLESLQKQMRAVFTSSEEERRKRTNIAKARVAKNFTWSTVARRHVDACAASLEEKRASVAGQRELHIGFISTWNTRCGIAEYTRYLASNLDVSVKVSVFADEAEPVRPDERNVIRCWKQSWDEAVSERGMRSVIEKVLTAKPDLVSLQFNFGFFQPAAFGVIIETLKAAGIVVFVTMHSTQHPDNFPRMIAALSKADLCIVHREEDVERLMQAGVQNTVVQRQGILGPIDAREKSQKLQAAHDLFVIACFGFFLPPKGIYELLQAFELAARVNDRLRLKLLNALYPLEESNAYAAACMRFIEDAGLADKVEIWTEFLPEEEILSELSAADLIVLPYTNSTESSSAAIRLPLASLTPILCSDLPIFDEFQEVVHRYPASDTIALANRMLELSEDYQELVKFEAKQREYVEELSWRRVARHFLDLAHAYLSANQHTPTISRDTLLARA